MQKKPVIGQTLWFVGERSGSKRGRSGDVTVTAVGRKWMEIEGCFSGRVELETMKADGQGFTSPGRCYLSKQDWLDKDGARLAWNALRSSMPLTCPDGLSHETIAQAAKLLRLDARIPEVEAS